ncbi:hypothetical protein [Agreia pratensis]|uniref:Uncharacterized protein n=1 Tax=Agreia pratensis TaxID=150121 RepID=A0A1X7JLW9_9MICO|nr:hypothetical protein [Agreia pratensis]SMG28835.1 hypothetical protein SAMN06296010_1502 [Agreia pratensis]
MAHPDDSTSSAPVSATHDVVVRRSPRFVRFIAVGIVLAIIITLILTFVFPEEPNYSRAQVFGFVGIIMVIVFVGLSAAVAVAVDRASTRRARTVVMTTSERVEGNAEVGTAPDDSDDVEPNEGSAN